MPESKLDPLALCKPRKYLPTKYCTIVNEQLDRWPSFTVLQLQLSYDASSILVYNGCQMENWPGPHSTRMWSWSVNASFHNALYPSSPYFNSHAHPAVQFSNALALGLGLWIGTLHILKPPPKKLPFETSGLIHLKKIQGVLHTGIPTMLMDGLYVGGYLLFCGFNTHWFCFFPNRTQPLLRCSGELIGSVFMRSDESYINS